MPAWTWFSCRNASSLDQRADLDRAEEDLGAFGLELDLAFGQARLRADVDDEAVEDGGDGVAVADDLHAVPLARRALDVPLAAEPEHVLPAGVAPPPVEAAGVAGDRGRALLEVELPVGAGADLAGEARLALAADHDEVAGAPL